MVGDFIKSRRGRLSMSQGELARRVGLDQSYVSRIERGDVGIPRRDKLEKFAVALDCGVQDFYRAAGMVEDESDGAGRIFVSEEDRALLELIHGDPDVRALLKAIGADEIKAERALLELWRPYLARMARDGGFDGS